MIKILLADDHQIVRDGLRSMLEKQEGFQVIAEADNGKTAVDLALELSPDVVVMDVTMPQLNGIEATRMILKENPKCKVITLSMHADKRYVTRALKAGALGYLLKDC